jgi:hypothetical protein
MLKVAEARVLALLRKGASLLVRGDFAGGSVDEIVHLPLVGEHDDNLQLGLDRSRLIPLAHLMVRSVGTPQRPGPGPGLHPPYHTTLELGYYLRPEQPPLIITPADDDQNRTWHRGLTYVPTKSSLSACPIQHISCLNLNFSPLSLSRCLSLSWVK